MGMIAGNEEEKSGLASEICELSARAIACLNLHHPHTNKSLCINWYLVLRVDENADIYSIKKQYRKLALQLHPDKNKHSKAETAFKLVSEAYYCLSDTARRRAFDSERKTISCIKCNTVKTNDAPNAKPSRIKELRIRLMNEAAIIHKSVIPNTTKATETPIFNPSDYHCRGYPHLRIINCKKLEDLGAGFKIKNRWMGKPANSESPIFEYRPGRSSFMSRCSS